MYHCTQGYYKWPQGEIAVPPYWKFQHCGLINTLHSRLSQSRCTITADGVCVFADTRWQLKAYLLDKLPRRRGGTVAEDKEEEEEEREEWSARPTSQPAPNHHKQHKITCRTDKRRQSGKEKRRGNKVGYRLRDLHPAERLVFLPPSLAALPSPSPSSDPTGLWRANGDQDLEKFTKEPRRFSEAPLCDPATSSRLEHIKFLLLLPCRWRWRA